MVRAQLLAVLAAVAAGCGYHASFTDCQVTCTTSCPDGFVCGEEGLCRLPGAVASCDDVLSDAGPGGRAEVLRVRSAPDRDLDLLFVVDDSRSMFDKQLTVAAALPELFAELATLEGGLPSLHVGVVSSDMGTKGSAVAVPGPDIGTPGLGGCSGLGRRGAMLTNGALNTTGVFLRDIAVAGTRERNYDDTLANAVGQMLLLRDQGCGFEQHLAAMRTALSPGNTGNAGFLRPSASLAVIVIADEDDCSVLDPAVLGQETSMLGPQQSFRCFEFGVVCDPDTPRSTGAKANCRPRASSPYIEDIAPFQAFLAGIKPDPRDVMFGVLAGVPSSVTVELRPPPGQSVPIPAVAPICNYMIDIDPASADPAIRLDTLVRGFPGHGHFESICKANVAPEMSRMARAMKRLLGEGCLERSIADRSDAPGIQPDCVVEDVAGATRSAIKACGSNTMPCWELVEDAARCTAVDQHLRLVVKRDEAPPAGARTVVRCMTP